MTEYQGERLNGAGTQAGKRAERTRVDTTTDQEALQRELCRLNLKYAPSDNEQAQEAGAEDPEDDFAAASRHIKSMAPSAITPQSESTQQSLVFEEPLEIRPKHMPAHYPTIFTRLPLFAATSNRKVNDTTEFEHGDFVTTSWGAIRRFGPGLNVYDEDTLIAIMHLGQQRKVRGRHHDLPISLNSRAVDMVMPDDPVTVHAGLITAHAINRYIGRPDSGKALQECRASIRRLSQTLIEIVTEGRDSNDSQQPDYSGMFQLFRSQGARNFRGPILIQFEPEMLQLLSQYTRINMHVRRELSDIGKAAHKYLSSQLSRRNATTSIRLSKLKSITGYRSAIKFLRQSLVGQLALMVELGFLSDYSLTGTGRSTPHVLTVWYGESGGHLAN